MKEKPPLEVFTEGSMSSVKRVVTNRGEALPSQQVKVANSKLNPGSKNEACLNPGFKDEGLLNPEIKINPERKVLDDESVRKKEGAMGRDASRTLSTSKEGEPLVQTIIRPEVLLEEIRKQNPKSVISDDPEVDAWLERMIKENKIEKTSEAVLFTKHHSVPKKGTDERRIVGNFAALNRATEKIPGDNKNTFKIVSELTKWDYKAKIDLTAAFYCLRVSRTSPRITSSDVQI